MRTVTIAPDDAGQRLDKFLTKYLKTMPLPLIYKSLRKKRVKVNGKRTVDGSVKLSPGDVLELYLNDEFFDGAAKPAEKKGPYREPEIIYEDDNLLVVFKPAGLASHSGGEDGDLLEDVLEYLRRSGAYRGGDSLTFAPALANRLDRNTEGLVLAAKNAAALRELSRMIRQRQIRKLYLCIAQGVFEKREETLTGYWTKDGGTNTARITAAPRAGAREAVTKYRVLSQSPSRALLEAELVTGRSHQIRAQLASIGHPLLGDRKYGGTPVPGKSQQLCACRLVFPEAGECGSLSYLAGREFVVPEPIIVKYRQMAEI